VAVAVARPGHRDVSGVISVDTVWDAADIAVTGDITVTAGASLSIAAGATVRFVGFHQLRVDDGDLQAVGTPTAPITFTSNEPQAWRPDLERVGAWNGLAFANVPAARDSSRLRWCVLEYAKALPGGPWIEPTVHHGGVLVDGIGGAVRMVGRSPLVISHSILRHNLAERGGAIGLHHGARPLLVNNLLHDNHATHRASGIYASYSEAVVMHNTFTGNDVEAFSNVIDTGCIDHVFAKPWYVGNILWGNTSSYYEDLQIREPKAHNTRFCDIEGWEGGEGCLMDDPQLEAFVPVADSPVVDAGLASAWLPARDLAGNPRLHGATVDMGAFEVVTMTGVEQPSATMRTVRAWPNPFNPRTSIGFDLPRAGTVRLTAYDQRGRRVATLLDEQRPAGSHQVTWEPRGLASGVYHLRLVDAGGVRRGTVLLLE